MPRNGSGSYSLPSGNPVSTGTTISSTWANTTLSDVGVALTTSLATDGQTVPSANLPMSGFKHTNVAVAVNSTDYARYDQVVKASGGTMAAGTITGSTIDSSVIGATVPAAGTFTTLTATAGTLNNVVIGGTTPAAGTFTALVATSLNGGPLGGNRNYLINGSAEIARKTTGLSLTTSAKYGAVDQCALWASGGSVSAGTLSQNTAATVGRTGNAARAAGVTLTGSGQISWRYRVESVDAIKLKNQNGSFQISVMHDVGSNINYTTIIRKPTATDNYASTTTINTSSPVSVVTGTATTLQVPMVAMGDVSAGIEIEVQAACGAVTTKNFDFTEWQLEEGNYCTPFVRRLYEEELRNCQRYLPSYIATGSSEAVCAAIASGTTSVLAWYPFEVEPRVTPTGITTTGSFTALNSTAGGIAATSVTFSASSTGKKCGGLSIAVASGLVAGNSTALYSTTGTILFTGCQL